MPRYFLGIHDAHSDPSAALVADGQIIAFAEEERHIRFKHANGLYPIRAIEYCLSHASITIDDIEAVAVNWDLESHTNGRMLAFIESWNAEHITDNSTKAWQQLILTRYNVSNHTHHNHLHWTKQFGSRRFPPIIGYPHHFTHAFQAGTQSGHSSSVVITVDGSGDEHCTVVWRHIGTDVQKLYEIRIPHSLGWFYAALTEYLGFDAYDGEYKVMGLAAYGSRNTKIRSQIAEVVHASADGIGYCLEPRYIHYGGHSFSARFTDSLPVLLGVPPRLPHEPVTTWHMDLAFEVQAALEECVLRLATWAIESTGEATICLSGGVAHNIKMSSRLLDIPGVKAVFPHPLCSDAGAAAGAALLACFRSTGVSPTPLKTLALGLEMSDSDIEAVLKGAKCKYVRSNDICRDVARLLAQGEIVGWCQGRMEGGPRALGQRSILADPRDVAARDRVNAVIKYREPWRPFCPSMKQEAADDYLSRHCAAPFMTLAFTATDRARKEIPAVVHVDGTARVQLVEPSTHSLYHTLLDEFEKLTGVPVLLNTSFNVKGEPIVCTTQDALRTYYSTGLDSLALGSFLITKDAT